MRPPRRRRKRQISHGAATFRFAPPAGLFSPAWRDAMTGDSGIFVGAGERPLHLLLRMANRHGLIAGATGTGKTVTLQTLAEGFSQRGVPVFLADVKGDLAGLSQPGEPKPKIAERRNLLKIVEPFRAAPVVLWDVFGEQGHPVRATVSDMGPLLLSR